MNKHYHKYKEGYKKRAAEWRKNNPEQVKENGLKYRHGMTTREYKNLFEYQKGCCAICGKHQISFKRKFVVDHNHSTLKNRGLLCYSCNTAVGRVEILPENIEKIINYLGKFGCSPFQTKNIK